MTNPPSSATPITEVSVDVDAPKARSNVGRNGPTRRIAVMPTTLPPVSAPS